MNDNSNLKSEWFEVQATDDFVQSREIKVVFLGDGSTGKSLTVARLMADGAQPEKFDGEVTPGIAIEERNYDLPDGRNVRVHFWDFGGQEILHSMHRIFLTDRTLYVVMINARNNTQDTQARYWLHNVSSFAPGCPVLLVLNQIDQNPNASINERALRKQYPNLTQIIRLSALTFDQATFNREFTDKMLAQIDAFKGLDTVFPSSWKKVMDTLRGLEKNYIRGDAFRKICEENGVEGSNLRRDLLEWFHDLGVSFCYSKSRRLRDYVVLKPDWITNGIYTIVWNKRHDTANGMVAQDEIYRLLSPEAGGGVRKVRSDMTYKPDDVGYILNITREFRLSFPMDNGKEFIPLLCNANALPEADTFPEEPGVIEFRMEYDYLPADVLHRLMVDMRQDLRMDKVWLTGALLRQKYNGIEAMVKSEGDVLSVYIKASDAAHKAHTYLNTLRGVLDAIHQEMGLKEPESLVAYKEGGETEYFSYEMLRVMQEKGQTAAYSRVFRKMIPIEVVLGWADYQVEQNKERLLSDLAKACVNIRQNRLLWGTSEDNRNSYLMDNLRAHGYIVRDQVRGGISNTRMRAGELDMIICKSDNRPWAACETHCIRGQKNLRSWNEHLIKLLTNYRTNELPVQILISYVECDMQEYHKLWTTYNDHMRQYNPKHGKRMGEYQHVFPLPELPEYLRVAQCSYDIGGTVVTVYHYFVHIGQDAADEELSRNAQQERWEKVTAEIAELNKRLLLEQKARDAAEIAMQDTRAELEKMVLRSSESEMKLAELHNTLNTMQQEVVRAELCEAELTEMKIKAKVYESEIELLRSECERRDLEYSKLQDREHSIQMLLEEARDAVQKATEERDYLQAKNDQQRTEIAELYMQMDRLIEEQRSGLENERKAVQIDELMKKLEIRQQELKLTEVSVKEAINKHKKLEELAAQLDQKQKEVQRARQEAASTIEKNRQLEVLYADSKKKQLEAQECALQVQRENALLAEKAVESTKQIRDLEQQLSDVRSKMKAEESELVDEAPDEPEDDSQVKREYRVIIMGDSESGKSQILYRLRHPKRHPGAFSGDSTPGIDIASRCWKIGDEWVRVNFWDFGGQEILHSLHLLFLAKNTLHVIVLNTRNDNQDEQAQFWMRYVELYAKGAPVILVLNKIDQNPTASLNRPVLDRMFKDTVKIKDVFTLWATNPDAKSFEDGFTNKLKNHIEALMDNVNPFTEQALQIRDKVRAQNKDQKIMDMSQFSLICGDEIPEPKKLAEQFNDAGMFVYFKTRTNMILNPEWITNAIYRILAKGGTYASNGIIDCEKIEKILFDKDPEKCYTKTHVDFVLKIMRKYRLSYPCKVTVQDGDEQEREFIPMLCKRVEPTDVGIFIAREDVVQMQLVFPYLPVGVVHQLMVDLEEDMHKKNVWLSGAMFRNKAGCNAAVIREKNRVTIYAQGENRDEVLKYVELLKARIEGIALGDMYKLSSPERFLGYSVSGDIEFFDYDRLVKAKAYNLEYVMSKYKPGSVSVLDILEQKDRSAEMKTKELLRKIAVACTQLQQLAAFMDHQEDVRNSDLRDKLKAMGYDITDQTLIGEAPSGKKQNELDLLIRHDNGAPWMIIEALNVSGRTADTYWDKHINKLMGRYNVWGLQALVLISYVDCEESSYTSLYNRFRNHMMEYDPQEALIEEGSFAHTCLLDEENNFFQVDKCGYRWKGMPVIVHHFFVHMKAKEPPEESQETEPADAGDEN